MHVGEALLNLAQRNGARGIAVVGTGKNVGKTVAVRAVLAAASQRGLRVGLTSIGRDGEAIDAGDGAAKPRLRLAAGTVVATARSVLPRSPASEILGVSNLVTAAGPLVYARVHTAAFYEVVGPPSASGVRAVLNDLAASGTDVRVLDGAVDRVAALAGGEETIVVAVGAAASATPNEAADAARALVDRLCIPRYDSNAPHVSFSGALTPSAAAELIARGETRQVVVRDPTRITATGRAFAGIAKRLHLACERPLRVAAIVVASIGRDRYFEPASFLRAVADATGLPTFDVYAGRAA